MSLFKFLPEILKEKIRKRVGVITEKERLKNLSRCGFLPDKIIDGGAFRGEWARDVYHIFPSARILMIEPQPHLAKHLSAMCQQAPEFTFCNQAISDTAGELPFVLEESNSRFLAEDYEVDPVKVVQVPIKPLLDICRDHDFLFVHQKSELLKSNEWA